MRKNLARNRSSKARTTAIRKSRRRHAKNGRFEAILLQGDVLKELQKLPKKSFDLIVSSPPYNIRKIYERSKKLTLEQYIKWQEEVIASLVTLLRPSGSICWQVGNYIRNGESIPLDVYFFWLFKKHGMQIRNRIIWKFNFGLHSSKKFSGRYETLLWFTKSDRYKFNLDPIRVPQIYPGKRHPNSKKNGKGRPSGNPLGKNPGDYWEFSAEEHFLSNSVWDIPNVKANHPEKTIHPCQFPVELAERCVLAFTEPGDKILDPFVGTGTTVIAALKHKRIGVGIDKEKSYLKLARRRISLLRRGKLKLRPLGKPVHKPRPTEKVAMVPSEWSKNR